MALGLLYLLQSSVKNFKRLENIWLEPQNQGVKLLSNRGQERVRGWKSRKKDQNKKDSQETTLQMSSPLEHWQHYH